jgi:myosin heavy subunit
MHFVSGAGKTETVKLCMNQIIDTVPPDFNVEFKIVQRILESNRLFEAFGNAKTRCNDNSSRFAKYTKLQFHHLDMKNPGDRPQVALAGSTCEVMLLEKSHVAFHKETERTFHAFYHLLVAPDDKKTEIWQGLKGTTNESFTYIGTNPEVLIDGKQDSAHFLETNAAMELFGVGGEKSLTFCRAIATCMQLGNLTFGPYPEDDLHSAITSPNELNDLANLLGYDVDCLESAFTTLTLLTHVVLARR